MLIAQTWNPIKTLRCCELSRVCICGYLMLVEMKLRSVRKGRIVEGLVSSLSSRPPPTVMEITPKPSVFLHAIESVGRTRKVFQNGVGPGVVCWRQPDENLVFTIPRPACNVHPHVVRRLPYPLTPIRSKSVWSVITFSMRCSFQFLARKSSSKIKASLSKIQYLSLGSKYLIRCR